jgi:hypothetical protein
MRWIGLQPILWGSTELKPAADGARGLGSPLSHLHRDCRACTRTGLSPVMPALGLGSPLPHLQARLRARA